MKAIIFHHIDNDGFGAARVTYDAYIKSGIPSKDITFVKVNYNMEGGVKGTILKYLEDNIDPMFVSSAEYKVAIVDLSINDATIFSNILTYGVGHIDWIDHHQTSIDFAKAMIGKPGFYGIHQEKIAGGDIYDTYTMGIMDCGDAYISNSKSAALLCWEYFNPDKKDDPPEVLKLISDHDTFEHKLKDSIPFFYGSAMYELDDITLNWEYLLHSSKFVHKVIEDGEFIMHINETNYAAIMRNAFKFKLRMFCSDDKYEEYSCIAVNSGFGNSFIFGDDYDKNDICIKFCIDQNRNYTYTLYSKNLKFMNIIAEKYGGGGHPGAAGFTTPYFMFANLERDLRDDKLVWSVVLKTSE